MLLCSYVGVQAVWGCGGSAVGLFGFSWRSRVQVFCRVLVLWRGSGVCVSKVSSLCLVS